MPLAILHLWMIGEVRFVFHKELSGIICFAAAAYHVNVKVYM